MICDSPASIKARLDKIVMGQEVAKWNIAQSFFLYEMRMMQSLAENRPIVRNCVAPLLVGASGTGKTFLVETLAEITDIPLIRVDCSLITASGWSGETVFDQIKAQRSKVMDRGGELVIIFLDEIDKIAGEAFNDKGNDHNAKIQSNLLGILDGKGCGVVENPTAAFIVAAGAFEQLTTRSNYKADIRAALIAVGLRAELTNRFTSISIMDRLTSDQLLELCFEMPNSPIKFYEQIFLKLGTPLVFTDVERQYILDNIKKGGARLLNSIVYDLVAERMRQIPANKILFLEPEEIPLLEGGNDDE